METGKRIWLWASLLELGKILLLLCATMPVAAQLPTTDVNHFPTEIIEKNIKTHNNLIIDVFADDHPPITFSDSEIKKIVLPYNDHILSFRVAVPYNYDPNKNPYFYKLEPIGTQWVKLESNRLITFNNLSPGNYTLHVKANGINEIGSQKQIAIHLIIQAPWWQTWWAYSAYLIFFIALLYLIRKYELRRVSIRNRRQVEQLESEKLKESNRLKSQFFANISHEFRTPLTLILGPVEDLMETGNTERFKEILPEVHRNSQRLLQLINQLLDLSKLNTNNYVINTTGKDIIPFISRILHAFHSLAEKKNIDLSLNADPTLSDKLQSGEIKFYFDEDMIEKIMYNLLSNAFKFTGNSGKIIVGVSIAEKKKDFLELSVKDNGIGIPKEKIQHVFDRFFQASGSNFEGSGVGLALAKELIELLHGEITVESEEGTGSTFYCYLPLNSEIRTTKTSDINHNTPIVSQNVVFHEEDEIMIAPEAQGENREHILVVDDHPDIRKYIRRKLEDIYVIKEARNATEGIKIAQHQTIDLIVSDVMMNGMNGFELCKRLKTDTMTSHIPIILLTARAEDIDKMTGLETGADAYLIKPFNTEELSMRIKKLIELRKNLRMKFSSKMSLATEGLFLTPIDEVFMNKILSIVESHISDAKFSVTQLSDEMNMSSSQLSRKLKAIANQSPQKFIRTKRMEVAMQLLENNVGNISEVSWRVGYDDPGYFTRVFKNYFGYLPSEKTKFHKV